jgi:hypothetical protein
MWYQGENVTLQEADTNNDRQVDVWVYYENGKKVRQDEDSNSNGKIDARYYFMNEQLTKQEAVPENDPDNISVFFSSVADAVRAAGSDARAGKAGILPAPMGMSRVGETR